MSASPRPRLGGVLQVLPILLVIGAMSSFQLGASAAKQLFPLVGPQGASALRLSLAAAILGAVYRPWRGPLGSRAVAAVGVYGLAVAGLNTFFYLAVQTVPLGVAVAIDFLGPLGLAVAYSRRMIDLAWVALAAVGIGLLLPLAGSVAALDPLGVAYCLATALCWALYILSGQRVGRMLPSGRATALGVAVAALVVLPFGIARAGTGLLASTVLPLGLLIAVLSSALPNSLDMVAMKRLPTRVFGVLMSLEPAIGAMCGWFILGEQLTLRQDLAIACVILASAGATLTAVRGIPPLEG